MAGSNYELLWTFASDTKGLEKGSRKAQGELGNVEKKSDKMRKGMGTATKALGALGLAFGAIEVKDFLLDAASIAKTSATVAESFDKVFGPSADRLREGLDDTRKAMGLGADEMEAMLLTTGTLAVGMGLPAEAAADMSEELFILAGDLQAFNPAAGTTEEALQALQAAIRGEFDPLERFGAKLSAAEVNTRALADSGKASVSDLSAQEKAIATVGLAADKTAVQQGALNDAVDAGARTSEILEAKMRDLKVEIGRGFLPIVDDITVALLNLTDANDDTGSAIVGLFEPVQQLTGMVRDLSDGVDDSTEASNLLRDAGGFLADRWGNMLSVMAPFTGANSVWYDIADGVRGTTDAVEDLDEVTEDLDYTLGDVSDAALIASGKMSDLGHGADGTARKMLNAQRDIERVRFSSVNDQLGRTRDYLSRVRVAAEQGARAMELLRGRSSRAAAAAARALSKVFAARRASGLGGVQEFATGGTVPGPRGAPVPAIVHGGEQVLTPAQQRAGRQGGRASVVINVNGLVLDPMGTAEAVAEALRLYERTNGSVL